MDHQDRRTSRPEPRVALILAWVGLWVTIPLVWANAVTGGPIFDDHFLVVGQNCFRSLEGIGRILMFEDGYACTYRPMRYLSYGLDFAIFGDAFWGFHVGSIWRHMLAAAVAGGLAKELLQRASTRDTSPLPTAWIAFFVAALWALHPVQTDSVSYVSGRRDVLAGMWTFATVWGALVADRRGGLWWIVPLWTTLFGFMSKESAVVAPALFLMWKFHEVNLRVWLRENLATAAAGAIGLSLSFLMVLYRGVFESQSHRHLEWWGGSVVSNFATVATLQVHYLQHVLMSAPLLGDYKPDTIRLAMGFGDPRALLGVALIVGLVVAAWFTRKRRPLLSFGVLWYLVALTPVSHIFPHHELFAEHYLYIPLFGAMLAMVDGVVWAVSASGNVPRWGRIATASAACIAVAMCVRVVDRNRDFANERVFYENVVAHAPNNIRAAANLGNIYMAEEEYELAALWLGRLAPAWTPGTNDERHHVSLWVEAAHRAGQPDVALQGAEQLAAHHPDLGVGHRWRAQLLAQAERYDASFEAAQRWWALTRDDRAIVLAVSNWHAGGLDADAARTLAEMIREDRDPNPRMVHGVADALARVDAPADALALATELRPEAGDPALDAFICQLAARLAVPSPPPFCPHAEAP